MKKILNKIESFIPGMLFDVCKFDDRNSEFLPGYFNCAMLLVDINGFTALSENLAKIGREGSEKLVSIINFYFRHLAKIINTNCGCIIKFGGDALLVMFPAFADDVERATLNSLACANQIDNFFRTNPEVKTPLGNIRISVSMSVNCGKIFNTVLGNKRLEYVVYGEMLNDLASAELICPAGKIIACEGVSQFILNKKINHKLLKMGKKSFYIVELKSIDLLKSFSKKEKKTNKADIKNHKKIITKFLPAQILGWLEKGYMQEINITEHRKVTCVFINLTGLKESTDKILNNLFSKYLNKIIETSDKYRGTFIDTNISIDGISFYVTFGAPEAIEKQELMAINFSIEIKDYITEFNKINKTNLKHKIGINTGNTFCGVIGTPNRRAYTVMGDTVNTAYRFMSAAKNNSIFSGEETVKTLKNNFLYKCHKRKVKGKRFTLNIYEILKEKEIKDEMWMHRPVYFIGREKETDIAKGVLNNFFTGRSQVLNVTGEAGIGKSYFVQKIISFVSRETTRVIHTECLPHNKAIPFFPWINILKDILDITGDAPASGFKKKVLRYSDRESARWLGEVMGISIEERAQEEFAGEQRKNKILKSFMNVISGCAKLKKALILILDDLHWFDDLSIELLFEFLKKFPPKNILLITTSRQTYIFSESPKNIINISLKPFTKNETSELIKKELPGSLFKDGIIEDIFKKSEGNPFFISEMVKTLKESRPLPEYLDVPGNIEQILMGRLDKLNVEAKDILKVASVIGVTFDMHLLKELLLYLKLGRIPVSVCIKNLRDTDFIDCLSRAGLSVYAFKHIMIQETVYNTLSYKVRRYLHRQIAQWYKKRFGPEIEKYYEIIATHFERANSTVSALKYLHLSYEKSMKVYANRTALDFLSRAEKIITRNHRHYNSEKKNALTGIYENKGLLYIQLGRYNSAIQNFKDMQYWSCKNNDRIKFAYSMNLMGSCYRHLGAHKKALSFCLECLAAGRKLKNNDLISSALTSINVIHWYTGNYRKAIDAGEEALNLRRNQGDLTAVSRGLFGLGNSYIKIGEIEPAHRYFSELRSISKKLNEKMGLAYALEGLGYCCMWKGNTRRALSLFEKSLLLRTRIEFYRGMAYSYLDIGSVYFEEGRFKFAEENFKKALEILKEIEDKNLKSDILRNLGLIELIKGRTEFAKKYIFEAYKIALETKFYESKVKTIYSLCIYYLSLRRFKKAEYFCNKLFACGVKDRLKEIFYKGLILKSKIKERADIDFLVNESLKRGMLWQDKEKQRAEYHPKQGIY